MSQNGMVCVNRQKTRFQGKEEVMYSTLTSNIKLLDIAPEIHLTELIIEGGTKLYLIAELKRTNSNN